MSSKYTSFGESFVGFVLAIIVMTVLFVGEPSIFDSLRCKIGQWSGTIPAEQTWQKED